MHLSHIGSLVGVGCSSRAGSAASRWSAKPSTHAVDQHRKLELLLINGLGYVGFQVDTLDGTFTLETEASAGRLPLLLFAYNTADASSRYMWEDAHSVQSFIKALPSRVHCLFFSYSGTAWSSAIQLYLILLI